MARARKNMLYHKYKIKILAALLGLEGEKAV
jgi:hypothetical protein